MQLAEILSRTEARSRRVGKPKGRTPGIAAGARPYDEAAAAFRWLLEALDEPCEALGLGPPSALFEARVRG
jgi:hypothetical protein